MILKLIQIYLNPFLLILMSNNLQIEMGSKVWGFQFHGIEIVNPSIIKKLKNFVIIICSTSYVDICKQLENYGLKPEINFFVSPVN